jgi:4-amino-4-deoxy-L-arabinose transferase-like glycosyltransferase
LVVLGVAAWLRLPDLAGVPPNVHGDEASIGLDARLILQGQMSPIFAMGWYDVPALSFAIHAATMRLFGDNLFGLRIASVLEGLLSIVLMYLLVRRVWGPRPSVLAAAFMAIAAWHIHFSRTGFHYMQSTAATVFTLYFMIRGVQDRRAIDWLLAGLGIGLSLEVYYAARLVPVIVAVYLGYRALTEPPFLKMHLPGLAALAFGALVFLAPMVAIYARNPQDFTSRTSGVLITTPANLEHEMSGYHVSTLRDVVGIQAVRTLEAFNIDGETSLQYGHPGPLFDVWTGGLLALSAAATLLSFASSRGVLHATWVWSALLFGSVLTVDALFSPRVLLALPALVLAPALMLDRVWRGVTQVSGRIGTYLFGVLLLGVLALALQANMHDYFDLQIVQRQPANRFTLLANYAQPLAERYRLYAIGTDDFSFSSEAPRFLLPNADAVNVRSTPLSLPLDLIPSTRGVAFLVENSARDYPQRMALLHRWYATGHEEVITDTRTGKPVFTSYIVENADLSAANPDAARN